jgi:hypothetical protein
MYAFSKKYEINLDEYVYEGFEAWMTSTMDLCAIAVFMRVWMVGNNHDLSDLDLEDPVPDDESKKRWKFYDSINVDESTKP